MSAAAVCAVRSYSNDIGEQAVRHTDREVGATATNRRVGAETSKTRDAVLDSVEALLLEEGYAGVSYRAVASNAGVTPSLIQYYFPTLDSMFAALIRRLIERDIARWTDALARRPDEPLRVLWEYSWSEAAGVLSMELMALGNHRPTVRAEITEGTERIRRAQLQALARKYSDNNFLDDRFTPDAMVLLLTSMPKYLSLEDGIDVSMGHRQLIAAFEKYLDSIEPKPRAHKPKVSSRNRSRS
jgi:TetR/AcrR family transcriptional regulator, transcriptional repressor for nem operon